MSSDGEVALGILKKFVERGVYEVGEVGATTETIPHTWVEATPEEVNLLRRLRRPKDGADVLACPFTPDDAPRVRTVGDFLVALAFEVVEQGEGFSGKRPFGNSGWENELCYALKAGGFGEVPYSELMHWIGMGIERLDRLQKGLTADG